MNTPSRGNSCLLIRFQKFAKLNRHPKRPADGASGGRRDWAATEAEAWEAGPGSEEGIASVGAAVWPGQRLAGGGADAPGAGRLPQGGACSRRAGQLAAAPLTGQRFARRYTAVHLARALYSLPGRNVAGMRSCTGQVAYHVSCQPPATSRRPGKQTEACFR